MSWLFAAVLLISLDGYPSGISDRFPDDPRAAKAVDKKEAGRAAAQPRQAQDAAVRQLAASPASRRTIETSISSAAAPL